MSCDPKVCKPDAAFAHENYRSGTALAPYRLAPGVLELVDRLPIAAVRVACQRFGVQGTAPASVSPNPDRCISRLERDRVIGDRQLFMDFIGNNGDIVRQQPYVSAILEPEFLERPD